MQLLGTIASSTTAIRYKYERFGVAQAQYENEPLDETGLFANTSTAVSLLSCMYCTSTLPRLILGLALFKHEHLMYLCRASRAERKQRINGAV